MQKKTFEKALHKWPEWHNSIEQSRKLLGYRLRWSKKMRISWIEDNIKAIRNQGKGELNRMELPPVLQQYWEDCLYSDYRDKDGNVILKRITRFLSKRKSLPELPCDQRIAWYENEDVHKPWVRVEIWIHKRFATKELFNYAAKYAFRTLEGHISQNNIKSHPVNQWLKGGRPPIDEDRALECARLMDEDGWSEARIGNKYDWALQENDYGVFNQCRTARRYIRKGRELRDKIRS